MSLISKMLLTHALQGQWLQLLAAVVFMIFLGAEMELGLDLFQFDWSLELGPLHRPNDLARLIFHGWSSLCRHGWPTVDATRRLVEWVLVSAALLFATLASKRVLSTRAAILVVKIGWNDIAIASSCSCWVSFCLLLCLKIYFRLSPVIVWAWIVSFDLFYRHLEHLTFVIYLPFIWVTIAHHFKFLGLCLLSESTKVLSLGSHYVCNNVFFWLKTPILTMHVSFFKHRVILFNVVLHLLYWLSNVTNTLLRARWDFLLLQPLNVLFAWFFNQRIDNSDTIEVVILRQVLVFLILIISLTFTRRFMPFRLAFVRGPVTFVFFLDLLKHHRRL